MRGSGHKQGQGTLAPERPDRGAVSLQGSPKLRSASLGTATPERGRLCSLGKGDERHLALLLLYLHAISCRSGS